MPMPTPTPTPTKVGKHPHGTLVSLWLSDTIQYSPSPLLSQSLLQWWQPARWATTTTTSSSSSRRRRRSRSRRRRRSRSRSRRSRPRAMTMAARTTKVLDTRIIVTIATAMTLLPRAWLRFPYRPCPTPAAGGLRSLEREPGARARARARARAKSDPSTSRPGRGRGRGRRRRRRRGRGGERGRRPDAAAASRQRHLRRLRPPRYASITAPLVDSSPLPPAACCLPPSQSPSNGRASAQAPWSAPTAPAPTASWAATSHSSAA